MKRILEWIVFLGLVALCLGVSECDGSRPSRVGYGYGYNYYGYNQGYYGDVFYTPPIDRYGYGFYGHP